MDFKDYSDVELPAKTPNMSSLIPASSISFSSLCPHCGCWILVWVEQKHLLLIEVLSITEI